MLRGRSLSIIFSDGFRFWMIGLNWRSMLMDSLGWLFPVSTRLRRKELIITTFLYTYCRSSPRKKGFLIGLAEACYWSWLGGIVLLDDLSLGCHSLVLGGWCRYHFLTLPPYEGCRRGRVVFRMCRVGVLDSLRFLIRKRMLKTSKSV